MSGMDRDVRRKKRVSPSKYSSELKIEESCRSFSSRQSNINGGQMSSNEFQKVETRKSQVNKDKTRRKISKPSKKKTTIKKVIYIFCPDPSSPSQSNKNIDIRRSMEFKRAQPNRKKRSRAAKRNSSKMKDGDSYSNIRTSSRQSSNLSMQQSEEVQRTEPSHVDEDVSHGKRSGPSFRNISVSSVKYVYCKELNSPCQSNKNINIEQTKEFKSHESRQSQLDKEESRKKISVLPKGRLGSGISSRQQQVPKNQPGSGVSPKVGVRKGDRCDIQVRSSSLQSESNSVGNIERPSTESHRRVSYQSPLDDPAKGSGIPSRRGSILKQHVDSNNQPSNTSSVEIQCSEQSLTGSPYSERSTSGSTQTGRRVPVSERRCKSHSQPITLPETNLAESPSTARYCSCKGEQNHTKDVPPSIFLNGHEYRLVQNGSSLSSPHETADNQKRSESHERNKKTGKLSTVRMCTRQRGHPSHC